MDSLTCSLGHRQPCGNPTRSIRCPEPLHLPLPSSLLLTTLCPAHIPTPSIHTSQPLYPPVSTSWSRALAHAPAPSQRRGRWRLTSCHTVPFFFPLIYPSVTVLSGINLQKSKPVAYESNISQNHGRPHNARLLRTETQTPSSPHRR